MANTQGKGYVVKLKPPYGKYTFWNVWVRYVTSGMYWQSHPKSELPVGDLTTIPSYTYTHPEEIQITLYGAKGKAPNQMKDLGVKEVTTYYWVGSSSVERKVELKEGRSYIFDWEKKVIYEEPSVTSIPVGEDWKPQDFSLGPPLPKKWKIRWPWVKSS